QRIVNCAHRAGRRAGLRKVSCTFQLRGNSGCVHPSQVLAETLVKAEEESLVPPYRPPCRDTELVVPQQRLRPPGSVGEEVARIELVVAEELIERAVQRIGPGLQAEVDHTAGSTVEFGGEVVGLDLELLRRVYRR